MYSYYLSIYFYNAGTDGLITCTVTATGQDVNGVTRTITLVNKNNNSTDGIFWKILKDDYLYIDSMYGSYTRIDKQVFDPTETLRMAIRSH